MNSVSVLLVPMCLVVESYDVLNGNLDYILLSCLDSLLRSNLLPWVRLVSMRTIDLRSVPVPCGGLVCIRWPRQRRCG